MRFVMSGACSALSPSPYMHHSGESLNHVSLFRQSLSPQMIILRVSMGRGWLKETANEFNSALEFTQPATSQEQSQETCVTEYNTDPTSGPSTLDNKSDASAPKDTSRTGVVSPV